MLSLHATARMGSFLPGSSIRPSGAQSRLQAKWRSCRGHVQIWRMLSSRLPAAMSSCSTTQVQLSWSDTGWGRGVARVCGKVSSRAHWLGAETCHASGTCSTVR